MNDKQLWEKLTLVFRSVFERNDIVITPDTTAHEIDVWDSLNHVQLILAVEADFSIRFKHAEVAAFENIGDMMKAIKHHLKL